jgi:hypothetical protein
MSLAYPDKRLRAISIHYLNLGRASIRGMAPLWLLSVNWKHKKKILFLREIRPEETASGEAGDAWAAGTRWDSLRQN